MGRCGGRVRAGARSSLLGRLLVQGLGRTANAIRLFCYDVPCTVESAFALCRKCGEPWNRALSMQHTKLASISIGRKRKMLTAVPYKALTALAGWARNPLPQYLGRIAILVAHQPDYYRAGRSHDGAVPPNPEPEIWPGCGIAAACLHKSFSR